jgi:hypothetical protein
VTKMASERVTVTVESSIGESAPLTVEDAMRQILDFFELLDAAGGDRASTIVWTLVAISMKSPLQATAEAVSAYPGVVAEDIARQEKATLSAAIHEMTDLQQVPQWMAPADRDRARRMFLRNTNGIGKTSIRFDEDKPLTVIEPKRANSAVITLEQFEYMELAPRVEIDLSRDEYGSIEGFVLSEAPFRGQPAIRLRERLSGTELWCVFSPQVAGRAGRSHSWEDSWSNRRVSVTGKISFGKDGRPRAAYVTDIDDIDVTPLEYGDIADPNFTGGLSPSDYVASLRVDERG